MDYTDILYEVDQRSAIITLNRPDRLNAWTPQMAKDLKDAVRAAEADPEVLAIIITGAGRGFCAGADMAGLNDIAAAGGTDKGHDGHTAGDSIEANYQGTWSYLLGTSKPTIAAVNGAAAGIGFILSLNCDMRFASEDARFGTAFAKLGLIAEHGISWLLPRAVGTGNALDLLYSARVIGAEEASKMGLVQRVFAPDELLPQAKAYVADTLAQASPAAMAVTKKLVWDAQFQDLANALDAADVATAERLKDPEFKEGLKAFAEKRPPNWSGLGN